MGSASGPSHDRLRNNQAGRPFSILIGSRVCTLGQGAGTIEVDRSLIYWSIRALDLTRTTGPRVGCSLPDESPSGGTPFKGSALPRNINQAPQILLLESSLCVCLLIATSFLLCVSYLEHSVC